MTFSWIFSPRKFQSHNPYIPYMHRFVVSKELSRAFAKALLIFPEVKPLQVLERTKHGPACKDGFCPEFGRSQVSSTVWSSWSFRMGEDTLLGYPPGIQNPHIPFFCTFESMIVANLRFGWICFPVP